MTVGERRLMSAAVASLELNLRKVRGLVGGTISDMLSFAEAVVGMPDLCQRCRRFMNYSLERKGKEDQGLAVEDTPGLRGNQSGAELAQTVG